MNRINLKSRRHAAGFTLIETAIAIVIGLVIIGGVLGLVNGTFSKSDVSNEVTNVNGIFTSARALKSSAGYGAAGSDLTATLINTKEIPLNMSVVGTTVQNSWGGAVTVASTGSGFTINYAAVPTDACVGLATRIAGSGAMETTINGGTLITGSVDQATANSQCSAGAANTITWTSLN